MIILKIYKKDDSLYWQEYFNSHEDLDKWLDEEMTRPYWDDSYTHEIEEIIEPVIDVKAIKAARDSKILSAKNKLKALGLTDDEIQAILGL